MADPQDPAEAIAAALATLRGRRGPRPGWEGGRGERMPPRPGPHGHQGIHDQLHQHQGRGPHGMPGWGPRFAGPARFRLLDALSSASGPLTVSEVADAVGVDQPRASRLVQQSVELGFVRREADPDDARRTRIVLTEQGEGLVRGFRGDRRDAIATALAEFTDAERADLARLLAKLAAAWPR